ncbi:MAG: glycosyltransferase [Candidatus Paceibacterota bacterium]|jgi:glycosyltransferase involved in cell wall biosynthesis
MRNIIKKIVKKSPNFLKKNIVLLYEAYFRYICLIKEVKEHIKNGKKSNIKNSKKRVLVYHLTGLNIGGTEKSIQFVANNLCDDFDVFFLYSNKNVSHSRLNSMNNKITFIECDYDYLETKYPFYIKNMRPHIKNVIEENNIDIIITATSGYTQYPINTISNIPIIIINIFGSPTLQKNIVASVFVSNTVQKTAEIYTGPQSGHTSLYIPVIEPPISAREQTQKIRGIFNLKETDFVFGRIGRSTDEIFDPIGIRAFQKVVKEYPEAHYIIMSPSPTTEKIVKEDDIPNVHFLPPSGEELDLWGFYLSIDCLAHFRFDGETLGLNIGEAMYAGKPIISHKSHIFNAHTEYLAPSFARVSEKDDIKKYASYMKEFIEIRKNDINKWKEMQKIAHETSKKDFSQEKYIEHFKKIINN